MKYYVYELVSSINGNTFYVGKGKERRMFVHENRARRKHSEIGENPKLRNKIKSIWRKGGSVIHKQIFSTDNDIEAYNKEVERIKEIGLKNLCNLRVHQMTPEEAYRKRAVKMLGTHISFETRKKISDTLKGHLVSLESRQKMRFQKLGKSNPCNEEKRLAISASKRPKNGFPDMLSPTGERHSIGVLTDFCKCFDLRLSTVSELLRGKRRTHRGWSVLDNGEVKENRPIFMKEVLCTVDLTHNIKRKALTYGR